MELQSQEGMFQVPHKRALCNHQAVPGGLYEGSSIKLVEDRNFEQGETFSMDLGKQTLGRVFAL